MESQDSLLSPPAGTSLPGSNAEVVEGLQITVARGEAVTVVGFYNLQVLKGTVELLGAVLSQSDVGHCAASSTAEAVPAIRALSEIAIFNISTVQPQNPILSAQDISSHFNRIYLVRDSQSPHTFHVQNIHATTYGYVDIVVQSLKDDDLRSTLAEIRGSPTVMRKILVTGKRGSGKSTFCQHIVNALLSMQKRGPSGNEPVHANGVLFLDLDPYVPLLTLPGVVYLAHVSEYILSPPHASYALPGTANKILKAHYTGLFGLQQSPFDYFDIILDLLSARPEYENCPIVINTLPSELWDIDFYEIAFHEAGKSPWVKDVKNPVTFQDSLQEFTRNKRILMGLQSYQCVKIVSAQPGSSSQGQRQWKSIENLHGKPAYTWNDTGREERITDLTKLPVHNYLDITKQLHTIVLPEFKACRNSIDFTIQSRIGYVLKLSPASPLYILPVVDEPLATEDDGVQITRNVFGLPYVFPERMNPGLGLEGLETIGACLFRCRKAPEAPLQILINSPIQEEISAMRKTGHRLALLFPAMHGLWADLMSQLIPGGESEVSHIPDEVWSNTVDNGRNSGASGP